MGNFELIKLASDVLLVAAVCFLSFRILASGSLSGKTAQIMVLEASLKSLIKDAEGTGRSLNDELHKRQHSLERLLTDLEGIEKRINQSQNGFEQGRLHIDAQVLQAQHIFSQITKVITTNGLEVANVENKVESVIEVMPEPPSFESMVVRSPGTTAGIPDRQAITQNRAAALRKAILQKQPLASQIERETDKPPAPVSQEAVERTVEQVNSAAKDVRKISEQMDTISNESASMRSEASPNVAVDSRLGVLGGMRRLTQTL